ncbi:MAG: alanine racemase [Acidobacteriota bacterium]
MPSVADSFLGVATPSLLVDRAVVEANCVRMREKAVRSGVSFRPHVKTHKTLEVARMQGGGELGPITVSTLAEAEWFADGGFEDITYAVPIDPQKLRRAATLMRRVRHLNLLLDHPEALAAVEAFHRATGVRFEVFLKVDCGYHRAGVDPDAPASIDLARRMATSPDIEFRGFLTHAGHSYNVRTADEIRALAVQESAAVTRLRDHLGLANAAALIRSVGSTPTASLVESFSDCEEVRPGNYVFYDAFQAAVGACTLEDVGASVLTSVIGVYPQQRKIMLDAGALALSKDLGAEHPGGSPGYGIVCDLDLTPLPFRLVSVSQEHGQAVALEPFDVTGIEIGSRLRIIPNHSCLTAALFEHYVVIENGEVIALWRPVRGW